MPRTQWLWLESDEVRLNGVAEADGPAWAGLDALEPRLLLAAALVQDLANLTVQKNQSAVTVNLNNYFDDPALAGTVVQINTVLGVIPVHLFDVASGGHTAAPLTVTNFLHYVNGDSGYGSYDNSIVHRVHHQPELNIIQGGGFSYLDGQFYYVNTDPPKIANEYSDTRPNVRGTIAMAMLGGDINSASDQWFINTTDNTAALDPQSFTVFGEVIGNGMDVADAIAAVPTYNASSITDAFGQLPLRDLETSYIAPENVILIHEVIVGKLTYTVTTTTPNLVNVAIDGGNLVINAAANQTGSGTVTVTARAFDGTTVQDTFNIDVQAGANPPVIGSLTATPNPVNIGVQTVALTANNVTDPGGGGLTGVEFFYDSNGNGTFQPGVDAKLGEDTSSAGGWTLTVPTAGWRHGANNKVFARALDADGNGSAPVELNVTGGNQAPTLTAVDLLVDFNRYASWTLSYEVLASFANEADANGDALEFLIAGVASGTLTKRAAGATTDVAVVAGTTRIGPGDSVTWTAPNTTAFSYNCFTIKAWDGLAASATPVLVQLKIDKAPVITSVTSTPTVIPQPGATATLTASAYDPDDSIAVVEFFYDTNNNGVFNDGTDVRLGYDSNAAGGWTLALTAAQTATFRTGTAVFFARAYDQHDSSFVYKYTTSVNIAPTIGGLTIAGPVVRGTSLVLSANGVTDAGGTIAKVEFFRDLDSDGVIDAGEPMVGTGVRQGATNTWTYTAPTTGYGVTPAYPTGVNKFIARVTDNYGGTATAAGTVTLTNQSPTIASLTSNLAVLNPGGPVVLKANTVADKDGTISRVDFFVDTNANGTYNAGIDAKIGEDLSAQYGAYSYDYTVPAGAVPGTLRFFAVAVDNNGGTSNGAATVTGRINAPPTIGGVTTNGPLVRGSSVLLTAGAVTDDGTVSKVEFYRDIDGDGVIDAEDKLLGTGTKKYGTNDWTYTAATTGYYANPAYIAGVNNFIAKATDNNGGVTTAAGSVTLTNNPPTVASLTSNLAVLNPGGLVTLKANTVADKDGTIARVEFFVDTNANGTYNAGIDAKIGEDLSAQYGAYSLDYRVPADAVPGTLRFFAVAVDNDGGTSALPAPTVTGRINAPPTIGGVTTNGPLPRGSSILLTAGAVTDDATVSKVEFFRDLNGNGTIDAGDKLIGTGTKKYGTNDWTYTASTTGYYANPAYGLGDNFFIARATDNNGGTTDVRGTITLTNQTPTIGSLTSGAAVLNPDGLVTLKANTVADKDGTVARVDFFVDTNGNGVFNAGIDAKIGEDLSAQYGAYSYDYRVPADAVPGTLRFFAVAVDNDGGTSALPAPTVTGRINAPPVIGGVTTNGPLPRGASVLLTAGAVTDDASVSKVEFYRDLNGNGVIDLPGDKLIGTGVRKYGTNDWTYSAATTGYYANPAYVAGVNHFIAKATDNNGGVTTAAGSVTLTNKPPTIGSLGMTPTTLSRGQQVTLTAMTVADTDGTVAKVEYFIDSNGNGAYDDGVDAKIGERADGQYGSYVYKYTIPTDAATGPVRFFAVATDNNGGASAAKMGPAGTILPGVSVAATAPASEEGPAAGTFRITRSSPGAALTVNFTLTGTAVKGTDYATVPLSAVIPANQTWVDVTITPIQDALVEAAETVTLTLTAAAGYTLDPAKSDTVTIADNDVGAVVVTALPGLVTVEDGTTATFQISLSAPPTADVIVPLASDNPAEGNPTVGMLLFTPANWNVNQTVTVAGVDDLLADGNKVYNIVVGPTTSVLDGYNGLMGQAVAVTNHDNEGGHVH